MKFKMNVGKGQTYTFTQTVGDLKAGYKMGDYSRISAYRKGKGLHTGARSKTLARRGRNF